MKGYKYWKLILVVIAFIALGLSLFSLIYSIRFEDGSVVFRRIFQVLLFLAYIIYYFYQRKKTKQNT